MKKIFAIFAIAAMTFSCAKPETEGVAEQLPITISTTLTRVTDAGYEQGDKVGLYVVNQPAALATSGNHVDNMDFTYSTTWTPSTPIHWLDKSTKADFYCYYPYAEVADVTAVPFSTKADQSTLENYKASEFLWGKTAGVAPTADAVAITTNHTLSSALVYLKAGRGFTEESLAAATKSVKILGVKSEATIDLTSGVATATGASTTITPYNDNGCYRALIVPQSTEGGALIVVTVNNTNYTLSKSFTFEPNCQYKFTVTLHKINNGINIGIGDWNVSDEDFGGDAE